MNWIESYFVIRCDVILHYAIIMLIAATIMLAVFSFIYFQEKFFEIETDLSFPPNIIKVSLIVAIVSILILILVPTTKECLAIKNLQNDFNNEDILNTIDGLRNRLDSINEIQNTGENK